MEREKIILIDGSGYFFRAFYAIQNLKTSKGFPTNALYGFINMLLRVLEVEKPGKIAVVFDSKGPSFRKERYSDYKANRSAPPEDLVVQIPEILRAVDCMGIRRFEKPGFEADDIIGTLAQKAVKEGYHVEIITGDKDLMQLVNEHVTLYDSMKERRIGIDGVVERFGVTPAQVVDLLALMGDSSDNIPGVSGVGEKTAAELLKQFGTLEELYKRIDEMKSGKRKDTLIQEKETAFLSQELARVHCDVPVDYDWKEFDWQGPQLERLGPFFEEFEFQGLLKRFSIKPQADKASKGGTYTTIWNEKELKGCLQKLAKMPVVAVDTETTSLTIHSAELVGVSLSGTAGEGYYIPINHKEPAMEGIRIADQISPESARELLKPFLEDPKIRKVGQNLKFDSQILRQFGINLSGMESDTLIASYLLDPEQPHNLDALAFRYLSHQNITYEEVAGKGKSQITFDAVPIDQATQYAAEDADVTLRLHEKMLPLLKEQHLYQLFKEVELPLVEVLAEMEYTGILVDRNRLVNMQEELEVALDKVQRQIVEIAGGPININSPKQLSTLLFEKLKLRVVRKTKTGLSTDESVLIELSSSHEVCGLILKYRELMKMKSTYVDGLLMQMHPSTHRVHTHFNQTVAATGRLSSSDPNLQNIPAAPDPRFDIRSAFIAGDGFSLLSADYSQVELRLLAHMSEDTELVRAFKQEEDVHEYTGRLIFGSNSVTPDQRRIAKTINFGVIYGQSPFGLSQQLKISPKEAKEFIDTYFARYAGVRRFLDSVITEARKRGFTATLLGRRRYLPEINSQNRMRRDMAERAAINAPIQGSAADLIKVAMVRLAKSLQEQKLKSRLLLQVHDELVLEVAEAERERVDKLVREHMENAMELSVALRVDVGVGKTWSECG